ncbi:MAG: hypothetical protein A2Z21_09715 [Candidatus Fraserbacteria bacterium RBG_16_55_9]|uniref:thioredoxin-dependent peroxiredoxin n=1 Tax=Fraserbacteria sp. (strain RBG_16_55_9) TaxID=1817864 RepID=A0A1F5UQ00_FRAXR|nr:MAG: hypothetical protein A2Z21_09715 [Candidatus Fraserbacteria bacterium RBG_16_55_9]
MPIESGAKAWAVTSLDQAGKKVTVDLMKPTVLYFYPKDDTPGCTKEACEFRDNAHEFKKLGAQVFGVSTDTAESHKQFIDKYGLTFTLLADPDAKISRSYGVLSEKGYAQRVTYLIREGVVRRVFLSVNPVGHSHEVLTALRELI